MKKSIFKISALLLVITLCAVSALALSFAKYKSTGSNNDSATVAKWGVTITASGNGFSKTEGADGSLSVSSEHEVVAPGMEGTLVSVTISGQPEVAAKVTLVGELELGDNWTVQGSEYCPLVITVGSDEFKIDGSTITSVEALETAVEGAIAGYSAEYEAGENLASAALPTITWEWAFDGDDVKDTALGDAANATITFTLNVTIEQLDVYPTPAQGA